MSGMERDGIDGEGENISSDDEHDSEEEGCTALEREQRTNNRLAGGAGKRMKFEDLQGQFGMGLKEAANSLGICPTTLKRACR
jgi:hypothetical protein